MPIVTGNFRDITGGSLDSREGKVVFTLNAVNLGMNSGGVRPDSSVRVTPDASTGDFSVNLEPTTSMALDGWYEVSVEWEQDDSTLHGYLGLNIRVTGDGGRIDELIDPTAGNHGGVPGRIVWVSQTAPTKTYPFMLWLQMEPGANPNPFDSRNTGNLNEWRP